MNDNLKKVELRGKQLVQNFMKIEKRLRRESLPEEWNALLEKQIVVLDASITALLLLLKRLGERDL